MKKQKNKEIDYQKYINKDGTVNLLQFYFDEITWNRNRILDGEILGKKIKYKSLFYDFRKWLSENYEKHSQSKL